MASKKDRKVLRREGIPSSGSEVQKMAELEACQRLLESGGVGSRLYNGPHIAGAFFTHQDKLMREVQWMAVDFFEQKKIALAHCRLVASFVQKYWSEKSRGSLSKAAGMIQAYWQSVEQEVRAPVVGTASMTGLFKLNTLQGSIRPSTLSTPAADDEMSRVLQSQQVCEWLESRESLNPPIAEGTTGLADYCVQVVKQHHNHLKQPQSPAASTNQKQSDGGVLNSSLHVDSFLIPMDSFASKKRAIENAIQSNIAATRGIDVSRSGHASRTLMFPRLWADPETQRCVLLELLVTNVMTRNPQLFSLAASSNVKEFSPPTTQQTVAKKNAHPAPNSSRKPLPVPDLLLPGKHYYVSVIFSTFVARPWSGIEDDILSRNISALWPLVATTLNWRMQCMYGQNPLRTAAQCQQRFEELPLEPKRTRSSEPPRSALGPHVKLKKTANSPIAQETEIALPVATVGARVVPVSVDRRAAFSTSRVETRVVFRNIEIVAPPLYTEQVGGSPPKKSTVAKVVKPNKHVIVPEGLRSLVERVVSKRGRQLPTRRAFSVDEMLRKNPLVPANQWEQFILGESVCVCHPSFANIPRIAEITLSRLVNSLENSGNKSNNAHTVQGPVSVEKLFGLCTEFRQKYPAIFTSHQRPQKPFMPPLRQPANTANTNKMVTRQATRPT